MIHIFNITKIRDKMNDPPEGQRLHHFFNQNSLDAINAIQKIDSVNIIMNNSKSICKAILDSIPEGERHLIVENLETDHLNLTSL